MTGVLQRLAARALGSPGDVRPRLAGRFESLSADGEAAPPPAPVVTAAAPRAPELATPHLVAAVARTATSVPASAARTPDPPPPRAAPISASIAPAASPRVQRRPADPPFAAHAVAQSAPPTLRETAAWPRPADAPSRSEEPPRAPPVPPEAASLATAGPVEPPRAFRPLLPDLADAATAPPSASPPPVAAAAAPQVHVTIGRIEVRAETPSRRPPPQRSAPPAARTMSLEDHLAGRGRAR